MPQSLVFKDIPIACRSLPLAVILTAALVAGACGKKNEARNVPPATSAAAQPTNAASPTPASGDVGAADIQRSVIRWIVSHHARPANFEQFAASADIKIPPPPPGKKFVLAPDMHVKVVDR